MASDGDCNCPNETWVTAAFRASRPNESYLFMKKECILYDHINPSKPDRIIRGPDQITQVFPSLKGTIFGDAGIDCAFGTGTPGKAYIFSFGQCAEFKFADHGGDDMITNGPMPIYRMFPFLPQQFHAGIDAAFERNDRKEAYLFKGDLCARIELGSNARLIGLNPIKDAFPMFKGSMFENGGFDAALTLHQSPRNWAAFYKGGSYAHIGFDRTPTERPNLDGPYQIKTNRPALGKILPRKNANLANPSAN